jgi:hypothetical protein
MIRNTITATGESGENILSSIGIDGKNTLTAQGDNGVNVLSSVGTNGTNSLTARVGNTITATGNTGTNTISAPGENTISATGDQGRNTLHAIRQNNMFVNDNGTNAIYCGNVDLSCPPPSHLTTQNANIFNSKHNIMEVTQEQGYNLIYATLQAGNMMYVGDMNRPNISSKIQAKYNYLYANAHQESVNDGHQAYNVAVKNEHTILTPQLSYDVDLNPS